MAFGNLISDFWQHTLLALDETATKIGRAAQRRHGPGQWERSAALTELEPRILFSAAPIDVVAATNADDSAVMVAELQPVATQDPSAAAPESAAQATIHQASELVIVDSAISDLQKLLDDFRDSDRDLDVFVLDQQRDGIDQITEILESRTGISSLHLVSHAEDGAIKLGSTWISASNLDGYAGQIASWQTSLQSESDLLLYGCDLAATEDGRMLIESLATLSGADVAASDDDTGHAAFGGDWELEFSTGAIESQAAISETAQANWRGKLSTITVDTVSDLVNAGDGLTSLREAILSATAGDTIVLSAGAYELTRTGASEDGGNLGDLDISVDVTIQGAGADLTTIDGQYNDRVFDVHSAHLTMTNLTVTAGVISGDGGGIRVATSDAELTLQNVIVTDNGGSNGAGIYNDGTITLTDVVIEQNGGVGSTINGGGLYNANKATIERVTISDNGADSGGGIYNNYVAAGFLTMTNVTISGNTAQSSGGGLYTRDDVAIINGTVTDNEADTGGGIRTFGPGNQVDLKNTIIAQNTATSANNDADGQFIDSGNNLIGDGTGQSDMVDGVNGNQVGTLGSPIDAMLAPLANNGGFAKTHAITTTSPAYNAGTSSGAPSTDQRGVARFDSPDIGAYEAGLVTLTATADTWLDNVNQSTNHDSQATLVLGSDPSTGPNGYDHLPIMQFDLSSIPVGATIDSATLRVYLEDWDHKATFSSGVEVRAHQVLEDWTVGQATWVSRDGTNSWTTPGGQLSSEVGTGWDEADPDGFSGSGTEVVNDWREITDLESLVQTWVDTPSQNYGIALDGHLGAGLGGTPVPELRFTSAEGGANGPQLVISYSLPTNSAPTDVTPNSLSVDENTDTSGGHSFGNLSATDPDSGETFTWSKLAGGDGALFTLNAATGELTLDDGVLDFETKSTYTVSVQVADSANNSYNETITVDVSDVNEAPTVAITPVVTQLDEDADTSSYTTVATISVTDDALGTGTLSLTGVDVGMFEIVGNELRLQSGVSLDFETNPYLDVTVNIDDATIPGDPEDFESYTIDINDIFEAPSITLNPVADTYLNKDNSGFNYGTSTTLIVDKSGGDIGDSRALLRFDLSSIPVGATITGATLTMQATAGASAFDVSVYEVTESWVEGGQNGTSGFPSWNDRASGVAWNGGTYNSTAVATFNATGTGQHGWDITALVQDWYDGTTTNNGLIVGCSETGTESYTYSSREGVAPPELQLFYTVVNATPTDIALAATTPDENTDTTLGVSVGTLLATDADAGDTFTWSIVSGADQTKFSIGGSGDQLVLMDGFLDYESKSSYSVTVRVTDSAGNAFDEALTINVNDLNDNTPVIDPSQTFSVSETAGNTTVVGTVTASDDDALTTFSAWTITAGNTGGAFAIDSGSGQITVANAAAIDYENDTTFTLTLTVTDGANIAATETVLVNVQAENDNTPVIDPSQTFSVSENAGNTTVVGTVTASDDDAATTFSAWTITAGNTGGAFAIDSSSGQITVANAAAIDYENDTTFTLTLTVSDGGNTSATETVLVNVQAENDNTPVIDPSQTFSVSETAGNTTVVGTVTASDDDAGTTFSAWAITAGNTGGAFAIDSSSGQITVANAAAIDYENDTTFTLTLTVSDGANTSATETVLVNVQAENDNTPVIDPSQTFSVSETAGNTTVVGTVTASDDDAATTFSAWAITAGNTGGAFAIDSSSGQITVANAAAIDYENDTTFTLTLTVSDGTNTAATETVLVNVQAENDNTPVIDPSQTFSVSETAGNTTVVGTVTASDDDTGTTFSAWTITAGNTGGAFAIDSSSGQITVANAAAIDYENDTTFTLTLTVSDGTNTAATETVLVNVQAENDNTPVIDPSQTFLVSETAGNTTVVGTVTASDDDAATTFSAWTITAGNTGGAFAIDSGSGQITVANAAAIDYENDTSFTLTLSVSDGTNTAATETVLIEVISENHAPTLANLQTSVIAGQVLTFAASPFSQIANDIDGDTLTAMLVAAPSDGTLSLSPDGSFTYTAVNGFVGEVIFLWNAFDGESNSNIGIVTITVLPIPALPPTSTSQTQDATSESEGDSAQNDDATESKDTSEASSENTTNDSAADNDGNDRSVTARPTPTSSSTGGASASQSNQQTLAEFLGTATDDDDDKVAVLMTEGEMELSIDASRSISDQTYRQSDRADGADALLMQISNGVYVPVSTVDYALLTRPGAMWDQLDGRQQQLESMVQGDLIVIRTAGAAASGVTVGFVALAIRNGLFCVSGLIAHMPAWRAVDPLLIMQGRSQAGDDETLEELMDRRAKEVNEQITEMDSQPVNDPS
ncbi:Cadherin domain protein [Novipirellula artificiosorum]|uniref:Cadherin domain protein n=2 Tax=Novipirellula artificiosorum TaxID=2528016 RepID=A0A5C6DFW8_9BACT|nr:Cadherin domain protein [Novipirellula artificiosorum]